MGNIYGRYFRKRETRILIQGLDAAGKTTILYRLKLGEVVTTIPTIGFNVETISHKNVNITAWDVGRRDTMRPLWRHYYPNTDAVIFVCDSNDRERMEEIKDELHLILKEDELTDACVLVIANKQDLPGAMSASELVDTLELRSLRHKWFMQAASALTGDGLYEGLDWIVKTIGHAHVQEKVTSWKSMTTKLFSGFFSDMIRAVKPAASIS